MLVVADGSSLVTLKAVALSTKPGGAIDRIDIGGALATSGDNVTPPGPFEDCDDSHERESDRSALTQ